MSGRAPARVTFLVTVALWLVAGGLLAQVPVVELPDAHSCPHCLIAFEHVATVGDLDGPGALESRSALVRRDSRGRIYVGQRTHVQVFDAAGDHLMDLGREGRGPGEFIRVQQVEITIGDFIHVFDNRLDRYSLFSPNGVFVKSTQMPMPMTAAAVYSGDIVLYRLSRMPAPGGFPFHHVDQQGALIRSFGTSRPIVRPDMVGLNRRTIAPMRRRQLWSAHLLRYVIELWGLDGTQLKEFHRDLPWFPPSATLSLYGPGKPTPYVMGLREDLAGRVWVLINRPVDNWREVLAEASAPLEPGGPRVVDRERLLETVIDVIDPNAGRAVATAVFPARFQAFADDDHVVGSMEDDRGVPRIKVWRMTLVDRP